MTKRTNPDHAVQLFDLLESPRLHTFTKWEQDFIGSIEEIVEDGAALTDKQAEKLDDIHRKYFD